MSISETPGRQTTPLMAPGASGAPFDLAGLIGLFRRRLPLLLAVALSVTLVAVLASLVMTPIYAATATIKVDPTQRPLLDASSAANGAPPDQSVVDTEVSILGSRAVAEAVTRQLNLVQDPEFGEHAGPLDWLTGHHGQAKTPGDDRFARTVTRVQRALSVQRDGTTFLIDVAFRSKDAGKAARIANSFADEYIGFSLKTRVDAASQRAAWLNGRLSELGDQAQKSDAALAHYRSATGLVAGSVASGAGAGTVNDQQIGAITTALTTAEADTASAASNANAAHNQMSHGGMDAVAQVLSSPTITDLRRQRAEVGREQAQINARYGPKHPEAVKVQQQIEGLDQQIQDETRRIIAGLDNDARASEARVVAMRTQLNALKGEQTAHSAASVEADSLERRAEASRTIYNQVAQTAQSTTQQEHIDETPGRIMMRADAPDKPVFPNKPLFAAMGLVLGLIFGVAAVLVVEVMDGGLRTVEQVERELGVPFIASVPLLTTRQLATTQAQTPWDFLLQKPMSGFGEAFRTIRSALLLPMLDHHSANVVCLTSAVPNEGKTVTAISLARTMAMAGDRVCLIDCDLRRDVVSSLIAHKPDNGLLEVLRGKAELSDVLVADAVPGLDLLPLAHATFTPRDVFGSQAAKTLLEVLRGRYDWILLDAPPLMAVADARRLAVMADATVMVARWNSTSRVAVRAGLQRLLSDGANVSGVILTMVNPNDRGALTQSDSLYYYGNYGKYYAE
jgi:capsular exopolysaccharide synthesis family protein